MDDREKENEIEQKFTRDILVIEHLKGTPLDEQENKVRQVIEEYLRDRRAAILLDEQNNDQKDKE